jgi:MoaA/NifB/PqqE/SkfB family radical SAM enzyme
MDGLFIELTNACNRQCRHCLRNRADPPGFLSPTLAGRILPQAKALGFRTVCLTGGEIALYPHLKEFLSLVVGHGFTFNLVTNGHRFRESLLPVLSSPEIREGLTEVCFSLDGATPETHDALRGPGSFREVMEAATLCRLKGMPICLKSVITNFNKEELTELALLGATLEAEDLSFLFPAPAPRSIREEVIPSPQELREIMEWIAGSLVKQLRLEIRLEGFDSHTTLFNCANVLRGVTLDYQGNLILCCNLSHVTRGDGQPSVFGREWLTNLEEVPLREGLIRHFHGVAELMEARVRDAENLTDLTFIPCYWCFKHFGKLEWLRDFPESPWSAGVLEKEACHAGV